MKIEEIREDKRIINITDQMVAVPKRIDRRYAVKIKIEAGGNYLTFETRMTATDKKHALEIGQQAFKRTLLRVQSIGHKVVAQQAVLVDKKAVPRT